MTAHRQIFASKLTEKKTYLKLRFQLTLVYKEKIWTKRLLFWSELFGVNRDNLCRTWKFGDNMTTKIVIIWLIGAALSVSECFKNFDTFVKNMDFCWRACDVRCYWQLAEVYLFKIKFLSFFSLLFFVTGIKFEAKYL